MQICNTASGSRGRNFTTVATRRHGGGKALRGEYVNRKFFPTCQPQMVREFDMPVYQFSVRSEAPCRHCSSWRRSTDGRQVCRRINWKNVWQEETQTTNSPPAYCFSNSSSTTSNCTNTKATFLAVHTTIRLSTDTSPSP